MHSPPTNIHSDEPGLQTISQPDFAPSDLPEGVTGLNVWMGGKKVKQLERKHVCYRCHEVMRAAWGPDCPICHEPMWIRFVEEVS